MSSPKSAEVAKPAVSAAAAKPAVSAAAAKPAVSAAAAKPAVLAAATKPAVSAAATKPAVSAAAAKPPSTAATSETQIAVPTPPAPRQLPLTPCDNNSVPIVTFDASAVQVKQMKELQMLIHNCIVQNGQIFVAAHCPPFVLMAIMQLDRIHKGQFFITAVGNTVVLVRAVKPGWVVAETNTSVLKGSSITQIFLRFATNPTKTFTLILPHAISGGAVITDRTVSMVNALQRASQRFCIITFQDRPIQPTLQTLGASVNQLMVEEETFPCTVLTAGVECSQVKVMTLHKELSVFGLILPLQH